MSHGQIFRKRLARVCCGIVQVVAILAGLLALVCIVAGISSLHSAFPERDMLRLGWIVLGSSLFAFTVATIGIAILDGIEQIYHQTRISSEIAEILRHTHQDLKAQSPAPSSRPGSFLNATILEGSLRHIWTHRANPDECRKEWERLQAAIASDGGGDDSAPYQEVIDRLTREGILSERHAKALAQMLGLNP